jgi:hypothetical protein
MGGQSNNQKCQIMCKINERDEQQVVSKNCPSQICSYYFFHANNTNTGVTNNLYFTVVHITQQDVMCNEKDEGTYRINMTEFSKKL